MARSSGGYPLSRQNSSRARTRTARVSTRLRQRRHAPTSVGGQTAAGSGQSARAPADGRSSSDKRRHRRRCAGSRRAPSYGRHVRPPLRPDRPSSGSSLRLFAFNAGAPARWEWSSAATASRLTGYACARRTAHRRRSAVSRFTATQPRRAGATGEFTAAAPRRSRRHDLATVGPRRRGWPRGATASHTTRAGTFTANADGPRRLRASTASSPSRSPSTSRSAFRSRRLGARFARDQARTQAFQVDRPRGRDGEGAAQRGCSAGREDAGKHPKGSIAARSESGARFRGVRGLVGRAGGGGAHRHPRLVTFRPLLSAASGTRTRDA